MTLRTEVPSECPPDAYPQAEAGSSAGTKGVALDLASCLLERIL